MFRSLFLLRFIFIRFINFGGWNNYNSANHLVSFLSLAPRAMEKCKNRSWTHGSPDARTKSISIALQLCSSLYHTRPLFSKPVPPDQWSHFGVSTVLSVPVSQSVCRQCSSLILPYTKERSHEHVLCPITMSFCSTCSFFFFLGTKCKGTLHLIKGPFCILYTKGCLIILPWCVNGTNNCLKLLKNVLYEPMLSFLLF